MTGYQQSARGAETRMDGASRPLRPRRVGINLPTVEDTLAGKTASWKEVLLHEIGTTHL